MLAVLVGRIGRAFLGGLFLVLGSESSASPGDGGGPAQAVGSMPVWHNDSITTGSHTGTGVYHRPKKAFPYTPSVRLIHLRGPLFAWAAPSARDIVSSQCHRAWQRLEGPVVRV